jgi:hypothetical protein
MNQQPRAARPHLQFDQDSVCLWLLYNKQSVVVVLWDMNGKAAVIQSCKDRW